jgi:hypothetical protein
MVDVLSGAGCSTPRGVGRQLPDDSAWASAFIARDSTIGRRKMSTPPVRRTNHGRRYAPSRSASAEA